jgi:hypothetical protein
MAINRLARAGAVEWLSNPAHRRSDLVQLTEKGRTDLTTFIAGETKVLEQLPHQISENDARSCLGLLRQVREILANEGQTRRTAEPARLTKPKSERVRSEPEPEIAEQPATDETELPVNLL